MELIDLRKELFVKRLDSLRKQIYMGILEGNGELVRRLYRKSIRQTLDGCPLWLIHGGELINLYSIESRKVPTKDIDLKMYFTGDYSIPPTLYKRAMKSVKPFTLSAIDFYDAASCEAEEGRVMRECKGLLKKHKMNRTSAYDVWSIGETQKNRMCAHLVTHTMKGTYSQLNMTTGKYRQGVEYETMDACRSHKWKDGERYKVFLLNTPYITQVGRENIPYDIGDKVLSSYNIEYEEDVDGYPVDHEFIEFLSRKAKDWTEDPKLTGPKERLAYLERRLRMIRIKHHEYKLSTAVAVYLVYNETRDEWHMFQEGILDVYIDYSAGHHPDIEKKYIGRYADGSFPSVLQKMKYKNKTGIMRVPSLTWLIYDQLRMLYVTLRGEYLSCNDKSCRWASLGGGAAGNYDKYFKKLQGVLASFESVIKGLQEGRTQDIEGPLRECKSFDLELCGPQAFINTLFQDLDAALSPKKARKKTEKAKKAKNKKTREMGKRRKRIQGHSYRNTSLSEKMDMMNRGIML